jgi:flavin reductase (DIM6/NTAB) family NADH-FMN oxidoreductase RutF
MADTDPRRDLAQALGRVPSGLFVLTARRGGQETGLLTSWVQQCSFDPPQVSLAVKKGRDVADWLADGSPFVLNILEDDQTDMVAHFGRGFTPGEPAFEDLAVERPEGGPPVLTEALAYLQCRVVNRCAAGDHDLFVADVLAGRLQGTGHPMVHVRKSGMHY